MILSSPNLALRELPPDVVETALFALLSSADDGILLTDLEHRSLACNRRFGEIWGVPIDRVVNSSVDEVRAMVLPRIPTHRRWEENLSEVYANPLAQQEDELELISPKLTIRRYTGPLVAESGEVIGRLWTFQDVSVRALRRRRREMLYDIALFADPDPAVVYRTITERVSEYFDSYALLSIRHGDFMEFRAVGGPTNPARGHAGNDLRDSFCSLCLDRDTPLIIQDARNDDGARHLLPVSMGITRYAGVPIRDSHGRTVGTLCILDNRSEDPLDVEDLQFLSQLASRIASELEREAYLKALRSDLASTQGTLQQTRQQLIQSEKLAVAGTLAASVAHDIRNILASMRLQLTMEHVSPERALEVVLSQSDRFSVLAHRLLSYAKPAHLRTELVNLHDLLLDTITLLQGQADAHSVSIATDLTLEDPWIYGDAGRLEHLFVNLVLNGIQAMAPGGQMFVRTATGMIGPVIEIEDNGPGIPPAQQATLFEPFSSSRADGFGLGLFSCREIARAHEALLTCHSVSDAGTLFRIEFPPAA